MRWLSRTRWMLARRPWIRWLMVAAAAALAARGVMTELDSLHRARDRWGTTEQVLVATRELQPGDDVAGAVVRRAYPLQLVPAAAVRAAAGDAVVVHSVSIGEVLVDSDIGVLDGPLALLPAGWLAVAVPGDTAVTWVHPGDAAVVLADGHTAAARAIVLSRTDTEVVVGVPAADAAIVADAANRRVAVIGVSATQQG
jgi:hypothetical protein